MGFLNINSEYLTEKKVKWYFWLDFIIGVVALGAAVIMYGTYWTVVLSVVSVVCIVDACLLRYCYEIKRTIQNRS